MNKTPGVIKAQELVTKHWKKLSAKSRNEKGYLDPEPEVLAEQLKGDLGNGMDGAEVFRRLFYEFRGDGSNPRPALVRAMSEVMGWSLSFEDTPILSESDLIGSEFVGILAGSTDSFLRDEVEHDNVLTA